VFQRPQDYVISGTTLTVNTLLTAGTVVSVGPTGTSTTGGGGGGTGTVTNIATSTVDPGALGFTLTGGPITTSGTVTLTVPSAAALSTALGIAPGGLDTHIQFNNAGVFGGTANLTYTAATGLTNIANLQLNDYQETVATSVNTGAAITPDFNAASIFKYTADQNFTFNGFTNAVAGKNAIVIITQDATGGRVMTSTMKFAGGFKVLSTAAGSMDTIAVFYDGTNYLASLVTGYA
jgi:hypothetical protein